MRTDQDELSLTNGPGAAAVLAAGFGCFALGVLAFAGDKSAGFKSLMNVYPPTGALSGVSTLAIVLWLVLWLILHYAWRRKTVALGRIGVAAGGLLLLALLLTFPPIVDFL